MRWRLPWPRGRGAEPLPPGPRGRVLFVGPFNGGVGGIERLTRCFADWADGSGWTATLAFEHTHFPDGPFTVHPTARVATVPERRWGRALEEGPYDLLYVVGTGLPAARWLPRLRRVRAATKVLLDLDAKRRYTPHFDVLHCEAPRDVPLPIPHVVAIPDPFPTIPPGPPEPPGDFHLTVFTPYGPVKGHDRIPAFLAATGTRLVWCYDPVTFERRRRRSGRRIRERVAEVAHPLLDAREAVPRDEIYRLLRACRGYVCFSRDEGLGWSMLDAVALGKPLAAQRIGVCRALEGFRATEDFSRPLFATYPMPPTTGFEGLLAALPGVRGASGGPRRP